ncbi:hypothetical protein HHX38_08485 [Streptomyces sp. PKU-MA01144]|uniref:hypothetical protein n=1 Tax=Streptomyces sp. PKU-MA01144 TaxID=2729138 RepID=UPI00148118CD|nr:hypothetical protein [Streptomyces sp. PKU-MA01144]NNJ04170.1 hypothetical protein [Streptomyces sp. PKU-MA01144]
MSNPHATHQPPADAVADRIRNIAAGWERDARLYPDARIGLAELAYILRTALEPVDGPAATRTALEEPRRNDPWHTP